MKNDLSRGICKKNIKNYNYRNLNYAYRLRYITKRAYVSCPLIQRETFIETLCASGKLEWISNSFEPRIKQKAPRLCEMLCLERITGLEPATSTLARWRSTK